MFFFFFVKDLLLFISHGTSAIHIPFQSSGQLREAVSHLRSQEDQAAFDDEGECEEAPELLVWLQQSKECTVKIFF